MFFFNPIVVERVKKLGLKLKVRSVVRSGWREKGRTSLSLSAHVWHIYEQVLFIIFFWCERWLCFQQLVVVECWSHRLIYFILTRRLFFSLFSVDMARGSLVWKQWKETQEKKVIHSHHVDWSWIEVEWLLFFVLVTTEEVLWRNKRWTREHGQRTRLLALAIRYVEPKKRISYWPTEEEVKNLFPPPLPLPPSRFDHIL